MLRYEEQQYVFKNGEFPCYAEAHGSLVKYIGGSPVTIVGGIINGTANLYDVCGLAAHSYEVDKEIGRGTFYNYPVIFTLELGVEETPSFKQATDAGKPYYHAAAFVAGELLAPSSTTYTGVTYAVWTKQTNSGYFAPLMVVKTDATNTYLIVVSGLFRKA